MPSVVLLCKQKKKKKIRGFWKVKHSISCTWNKEYYNVSRNISELCKRDLLYDIKYYVYNLPHEFPNESKLSKLGINEKI